MNTRPTSTGWLSDMARRPWCILAQDWYEDPAVMTAAESSPLVFALWPMLIAKAKNVSSVRDNPEGHVEWSIGVMARHLFVEADDVRAALKALEGAELIVLRDPREFHGKVVSYVIELARFEKWQTPGGGPADRSAQHRDRLRRESGSFVYFILDEHAGRVKIGRSVNPWARKRELQTGAAGDLHLVHYEQGTPNDEEGYHERFASLRVRGEWFEHDGELRDFLALRSDSVATVVDRSNDVATETETETEKERELSESPRPTRDESDIAEVFDHWVAKCWTGKGPRPKLTAARRSVIRARRREGWTVDELRQAIDGFAADPFYNGDNGRGKRYLELTHRLNAEGVEKGIELAMSGRRSGRRGGIDLTGAGGAA